MIDITKKINAKLYQIDIEAAIVKYLQNLGWQPKGGTMYFEIDKDEKITCFCEVDEITS